MKSSTPSSFLYDTHHRYEFARHPAETAQASHESINIRYLLNEKIRTEPRRNTHNLTTTPSFDAIENVT